MPKKFKGSDIKESFKKVPTPVKQKVVKDLVAASYSQAEIAEMFGVSAMTISKLKNAELNDDGANKKNIYEINKKIGDHFLGKMGAKGIL